METCHQIIAWRNCHQLKSKKKFNRLMQETGHRYYGARNSWQEMQNSKTSIHPVCHSEMVHLHWNSYWNQLCKESDWFDVWGIPSSALNLGDARGRNSSQPVVTCGWKRWTFRRCTSRWSRMVAPRAAPPASASSAGSTSGTRRWGESTLSASRSAVQFLGPTPGRSRYPWCNSCRL